MHKMLPTACTSTVEALNKARVRDRLYSEQARSVTSRDLLVNNVGVSAAYQSPPHFDVGDVGWTFAFSCKCGACGDQHVQELVGDAVGSRCVDCDEEPDDHDSDDDISLAERRERIVVLRRLLRELADSTCC